MRKITTLLVATAAVAAALPALAQTNPYSGRSWQQPPRESYGSYRGPNSTSSTRSVNPYSAPPGYQGTIHWNTPNRDGNLGGPGGGGSSGSPGG